MKKDGYDAVTINKFFGKGLGDINLGVTYDWSKKKLIVFDELLLNNMYFMNMVKDFVIRHGDEVKVIANGDINQLQPINSGCNNIKDENRYRMECVTNIFPNIITLKEITRLKKQRISSN